MSTVNSRDFVDNIIRHQGFYNGDDEDAPDNPRCVRIVEFTNAWGKTAWGLIFAGGDLDKYAASEYVINPSILWNWEGKG